MQGGDVGIVIGLLIFQRIANVIVCRRTDVQKRCAFRDFHPLGGVLRRKGAANPSMRLRRAEPVVVLMQRKDRLALDLQLLEPWHTVRRQRNPRVCQREAVRAVSVPPLEIRHRLHRSVRASQCEIVASARLVSGCRPRQTAQYRRDAGRDTP